MRRIRFALRTLAKTPGVTLVVVLSLGLGIGANTAIFSLLYQMILQTLPVQRPEELVVLQSPREFKSGRVSNDNSGGSESIFSYRFFRALEKDPRGLTAVAGSAALAPIWRSGTRVRAGRRCWYPAAISRCSESGRSREG